ncbi:MAG TPA: DEAD/DEAH box helicase [Candidatus Thermoplasmatota archaeon]|nr:DEAD/DEAH box helicase [Candidatus Thermoplasmatota archaeon]
MVKFESFHLSEPVLRALADMGFESATPIQEAALPLALAGRDVVAQAQTGTGKTAAFGIPIVEAALKGRPSLVLVPTRELAQQVAGEIDRIGQHAGVRSLALYGGAPFNLQLRALARGDAAVLVATPGRLRDHLARGTVDLAPAAILVLDEADEMLDMGFLEEVEEILAAMPKEKQTMLFSATMPPPIQRLAERFLRDPETVALGHRDGRAATVATTEQFAVDVRHSEKVDALVRILAVERPTGTIVFRHTRETVDELVGELRRLGLAAESLHGGHAQQARDAVLGRFRDGSIRVLVATNVAARGLDVDSVSHVVNYDAPRETDAYVHRIGRTGRAGRSGRTFLFVTPADRGRLRGIERAIKARLSWYEVPADASVHAAVGEGLALWAEKAAQDAAGLAPYTAAVDAAVARGVPLREVAAAALRSAARAEGLSVPQLAERRERPAAPRDAAREPSRSTAPRVAVAIDVGREDGVRPADIVGAFTHEGGLTGPDIGRIDILPRMSVAEVPADRVDELQARLAEATIRRRPMRLRLAAGWEFRPIPRGPQGHVKARSARERARARSA